MSSEAILGVRLALAVVFARSAMGKLRHPREFIRGVAQYDILPRPLAYAAGVVLIPMEALFALSHLTGWQLFLVSRVSLITLLTFTVAVLVNLARGRALPCYCFVSSRTEAISARTITRLAVLITCEIPVVSWGPLSTSFWDSIRVSTTPGAAFDGPIFWVGAVFVTASWFLTLPELQYLFWTRACGGPRGVS
jgi:hypothetical protein